MLLKRVGRGLATIQSQHKVAAMHQASDPKTLASGSPPAMVEKNSTPGNVKCYTDSCRGEVSVQRGGKRQ